MIFRKLSTIVIVLLLGLSWSCSSDIEERIAEEEIKLAMREQQDAWNAGDIDLFMSWYLNSPDLSFASSKGVMKSHEAVLARYHKSYPNKAKMGRLEFEFLEYYPSGENHAVLVGAWSLVREGDNPSGYFTLLWQRTADGWKIIHDHTS